MAKSNQPTVRSKPHQNRQIVGFSLPLDLAIEVKTEAARRNISLRNLFTELWALYQAKRPA